MGGHWSGWYRNGRLAVEQCHRLDVSELYRLPALRKAVQTGQVEPTAWRVSWTNTDSRIAEVSADVSLVRQATGPAVRITYPATSDASRVGLSDPVALCSTPCPYGGVRPWFRCPGFACDGRRVRILYLLGGLFRCRVCHRLTYASRKWHRSASYEVSLIFKRQQNLRGRLSRARSPRQVAKLEATWERLESRVRQMIFGHGY